MADEVSRREEERWANPLDDSAALGDSGSTLGTCEVEGCEEPPTVVVWSEESGRFLYCCGRHGKEIMMGGKDRRMVSCPQCGCTFGVEK